MRAARTAAPGIFEISVRDILNRRRKDPEKASPERLRDREAAAAWSAVLAFGLLFFVGYVAGVWVGRTGQSGFGNHLAEYYRNGENFSAFLPLFQNLFGSAFLQGILVLVCGFSALGTGFLCLYFAARGAILGLCAACVFVQGGTKALVIHWMLTCLPDLGVFLVMLWLAVQANRCAGGIFRILLGGGSHLRQMPPIKQLVFRFATAVLLCVALCLAAAASGVLFAGVLL